MTSIQQRAELHRQIWQIANDVRGSVDGWDFKQYVLGALFYRFISENFSSYIEAGDDSICYAKLDDSVITDDIKDDAIKTKGYFIYPSQLFCNVAAKANTNDRLNADLNSIFVAIESSAYGYPSEADIKGLFADFDTTSNRLGNTVKDKNARLAAVLKGVEGLKLGDFNEHQIDLFGDAYEFLISNYAANAGKSGGEFFTPQHVSKLIAQLAMHGQPHVNKIYDPAAGSGSLLLQAKKQFDNHIIEEGFFGQEINHTTYNLARMNMFLHNINYDKFDIKLGNTLTEPHFRDEKPFDAIVSNPPYSVKWIGSDDPTLINDERFAPAGVLAPKSKADFAFVLHALNYLSAKGRAAIVCFPGIFYRGGAEQKIRQYLIDDGNDPESEHDFGKNIIPRMLEDGRKMYAYSFDGYWRDVGTIDSLWEANMDIIKSNDEIDLNSSKWKIYTNTMSMPPQYIGKDSDIQKSLVADGCKVLGKIENSVLSHGVSVGSDSIIKDSVIMPNVKIGKNVIIEKAMIGEGAIIEDNTIIKEQDGINVISEYEVVKAQLELEGGF